MNNFAATSIACAVVCCFGSGCADYAQVSDGEFDVDPAHDEDVASVEQAFGADSCGRADADHTTTSNFYGTRSWTTPRSYNTCYKGYVVDLDDYVPTSAGTSVSWADSVATTQTDCENQFMRVYLYQRLQGIGNLLMTTFERHGTWTPPGPGVYANCQGPELRFDNWLGAGADYRIAVTARPWDSSAAPTRKVKFSSMKAPE